MAEDQDFTETPEFTTAVEAEPVGLDFSKARSVTATEDAGVVVHIQGPDGTPLYFRNEFGSRCPVTIRVAGTYSSIYKRGREAQNERMVKQNRRQLTGEMIADNALEMAAICCIAWEGIFHKGAVIQCNKENAKRLLGECPWVKEQVEEAMGNHADFSKTS